MTSRHMILLGLCVLVLALSLPVRLSAAAMENSHGHDLDALWAKAQKQYDLKAHDAILLLEGRYVTILGNGNLRTRVHRVVWVGTEMGVEHHADLRIPWNSATSTFTVVALRTWRDGRWWPHESEVSETAVVETLPFALALADDYASMRETMLLHDGVELPCIMETIYEIEEQGAAGDGADDLFVFPQNDPALLVEYRLTVPDGVIPKYRSGNGAPEPETVTGEGKATTYTWKMEKVDRLGTPRITFPAEYASYVNWSTWESWEALGEAFKNRFDEAAVLNDALTDSLIARIKHEQTPVAKVRAIAELIDEWTRNIEYDWKFWRNSPRPATRTYETAYGHGLDRAVLAAALMRACGVKADPCIVSETGDGFPYDIPGLSPFGRFGVITRYIGGLDSFYDPADGSLTRHLCSYSNCFFWELGVQEEPQVLKRVVRDASISRFELSLTIEPVEDGKWIGSGYLNAAGMFRLYDEIAGEEDGASTMIEEIVQSVLPSAQIEDYTPERFMTNVSEFIFRFSVDDIKRNDLERIHISIGEPARGLLERLPQDVHLYEDRRSSPTLLGGAPMQRVELRLKTENRDIVYMPQMYEMENEVGRFGLTVEREGGWITIGRELHIDKHIVQHADWPLLRALLLEEQDPAHRTIILK